MCVCVCARVHMLKERKSEVCVEGGQKDILSVRMLKWEEKKSCVCVCLIKEGQYNITLSPSVNTLIARGQRTM